MIQVPRRKIIIQVQIKDKLDTLFLAYSIYNLFFIKGIISLIDAEQILNGYNCKCDNENKRHKYSNLPELLISKDTNRNKNYDH